MTATSFLCWEEESELLPLGDMSLPVKKQLSVFVSCCYTSITRSASVLLLQSLLSDVLNRAVSRTSCYRACSSVPVLVFRVSLKLQHLADGLGEW